MDIDPLTIFTLLTPEEQELVKKYQSHYQTSYVLMASVPNDKIPEVKILLQKLYPGWYINVKHSMNDDSAIVYRSRRARY